MALDQQIENIVGYLIDAYKQAVPGTVLCVDQLMTERRTNPVLRDSHWFCTADGAVYSIDGKTPTLRITREPVNPVLNHIDDAVDQLVNAGNYKILPADFEAVKAAKDTVTIDLTKLRLRQSYNPYYCSLAVDTSKAITEYNNEQQKLLRRFFGPTNKDYSANMKMLRKSPQRIKETRVYVLDPEHVEAKAKKGPIAQASCLVDFYNFSCFYVYNRYVDNILCFRGVRKLK